MYELWSYYDIICNELTQERTFYSINKLKYKCTEILSESSRNVEEPYLDSDSITGYWWRIRHPALFDVLDMKTGQHKKE